MEEAPSTSFGTDLISAMDGVPIPAPLKRGFWAAAARLGSGLIDIPAAKLESYAEDTRSATAARKTLMDATAKSIAAGFQDAPEFARRAQARFASKILREQVNVDDILKVAAENLSDSTVTDEPAPVDDDWLNHFESEAVNKSSSQMKALFGRILAGEIGAPGSFSIKSIKTISEIDKHTAQNFSRLCSLSFKFIGDTRVLSLGQSAAANSLQKYGLSFPVLNDLEHNGLVISDYDSYLPIGQLTRIPIGVDYAGKTHRLVEQPPGCGEFKVRGVGFTKVGRELRQLIDMTEDQAYTQEVLSFFRQNNVNLLRVAQP
jgi:Protein of unknown function (DUF2806)